MKLSESKIRKLREYLMDKPVLKAYVFGSYARGDADEGSDLDLLLDLDYSHHIGLLFFRMKSEIEEILQAEVDVATQDSISRHIMHVVDREKVLIYEKQPR